jgi:hypothetical protein
MVPLQSKMAKIPSAVAQLAGENENIPSSQLIGIHCVNCIAVLV